MNQSIVCDEKCIHHENSEAKRCWSSAPSTSVVQPKRNLLAYPLVMWQSLTRTPRGPLVKKAPQKMPSWIGNSFHTYHFLRTMPATFCLDHCRIFSKNRLLSSRCILRRTNIFPFSKTKLLWTCHNMSFKTRGKRCGCFGGCIIFYLFYACKKWYFSICLSVSVSRKIFSSVHCDETLQTYSSHPKNGL